MVHCVFTGGIPGAIQSPGFGRVPSSTAGKRLANRMILRDAILRHGFKPLDSEWWHFTLKNEPFPDTYFNFPIY